MYETHKDNKERIDSENRRLKAVNDECQAAITTIMKRENLDARIVFYPKDRE